MLPEGDGAHGVGDVGADAWKLKKRAALSWYGSAVPFDQRQSKVRETTSAMAETQRPEQLDHLLGARGRQGMRGRVGGEEAAIRRLHDVGSRPM